MKGSLLLILVALLVSQDEKEIKDKQAEVMAFVKTAKSERDLRAALADLSKLAEQSFQINRYDLAAKLYSDAEKIARASVKDAALAQSLLESGKKAAEVGKEYAKASKAMGNILRNEGTLEDYTTSGRFLCFVKGDWELGLSDLSKGKDEGLKKLALDDVAAASPVALADAWFALLKKEPAVKERSLHWYAKAWPTLAGVEREKIRARAFELQRKAPAAKQSVPAPSPWQSVKSTLTTEFAHSGTQSVCVTDPPGNGSPAGFFTKLSVAGKGTLAFRAWVMTDGNGANDLVAIGLSDAAGKAITPGQINVPLPSDQPFWTKIEQTLVLPKDTATIAVGIQFYSPKGMLWIDDISIRSEGGAELLQNGGFEEKK